MQFQKKSEFKDLKLKYDDLQNTKDTIVSATILEECQINEEIAS